MFLHDKIKILAETLRVFFSQFMYVMGEQGGGGGYTFSTKFYAGGLRSEVQLYTPLDTILTEKVLIFFLKRCPFPYLLIPLSKPLK